MSQFRVQYSINTSSELSETAGWESNTNSNNLEMTVEAIGMSQAQAMVEGMYGGPSRCWIKSVIPV